MININNVDNFNFEFPGDLPAQIDISEQLEVGDIVFEKLNKNPFVVLFSKNYIEALIVISQIIVGLFYKFIGKDPGFNKEFAKIQHVYQVVEINRETGQVLLADSVASKKNTLRIIDLWQDRSTSLKNTPEYELQFVRLNDPNLAEKSAALTKQLGRRASYLLADDERAQAQLEREGPKSGFSYKTGMQSIYNRHPVQYSSEEKIRMMKKLVDILLQNRLATDGSSPTNFFCSYFISDQLLGANLPEAFQNVYNQLDKIEQSYIQDLIGAVLDETEGLEYRNLDGMFSSLAEVLAERYGDQMLDELNQMATVPKVEVGNRRRIIDPKHMSPQMLARVLYNPEFGQVVGRIVPPKKT